MKRTVRKGLQHLCSNPFLPGEEEAHTGAEAVAVARGPGQVGVGPTSQPGLHHPRAGCWVPRLGSAPRGRSPGAGAGGWQARWAR